MWQNGDQCETKSNFFAGRATPPFGPYSVQKKEHEPHPIHLGINLRPWYLAMSNTRVKIDAIFDDFKYGRLESRHYVSTPGGERHLVTMIPMFEDGDFSGCVSQVHPLGGKGPEKSFP